LNPFFGLLDPHGPLQTKVDSVNGRSFLDVRIHDGGIVGDGWVVGCRGVEELL
jgi:hypothetical protein